jgi:hypothetical protein
MTEQLLDHGTENIWGDKFKLMRDVIPIDPKLATGTITTTATATCPDYAEDLFSKLATSFSKFGDYGTYGSEWYNHEAEEAFREILIEVPNPWAN